MSWLNDAACVGYDPELFFPIGNSDEAMETTLLAKSICRGCPVAGTCLSEALRGKYADGVWGGLDENERRDLHARRRAS